MTDRHDVPNDLYGAAVAIARKIGRQHGLRQDDHRIEDIAQTLFLAGWEVWRDTGEVGLAKHRMTSRRVNMIDDLRTELARPCAASQLSERAHARSLPVRSEFLGPVSGDSPLGEQLVEEFLNRMPERRQQIARHRMTGATNKVIAEELGIPVRTVEREITTLKKETDEWKATLCH